MALELKLLGEIAIWADGSPVAVGHARQRWVLGALLVDANRVVSVDQLVDRVWSDRVPQRARNTLAGYVSRLRRVVAQTPQVEIGWHANGYVLTVDPMAVDLHRFRQLAHQARECGDPDRAIGLYEAALRLCGGEALPSLDTPWAREVRDSMGGERLAAELDRNDLLLAAGRHAEIVGDLARGAEEHPFDERLAAQLLVALYRCGRQAEALRCFDRLRRRLAEELGVDPSAALRAVHRQILTEHPAVASFQRGNGLPVPLTNFVGREGDLARVRPLIAANRLVTITGTGGAGKTRLALAAVGHHERPGGVWLAELATLADPELLPNVVAAAMGIREHGQRPVLEVLAEKARGSPVLIILDSCEHLAAPVARLAQWLLHTCPRLSILATSRIRLGVTGEVLHPLGGLSRPDAIQLFRDRAAAVAPAMRWEEKTAASAGLICERLDGLPLAIELAAARTNALGVADIAARLDDRFALLTGGGTDPPRHRTLRAVVDWSYDLLSPAERKLFDRLAVFQGGFTLAMAGAVCDTAQEDSVAGLLAALVDASLTVAEEFGGSRRYRMLETLRAYGLGHLRAEGVEGSVRDRHASHMQTIVAAADEGLRGPDQARWLRRLQTEHANIVAALSWSADSGDVATAAAVASMLCPLWDRHGHYDEGRRWLRRILAMPGAIPSPTRVRLLVNALSLAVIQADAEQIAALGQAALSQSQEAGDLAGLAMTLQHLGLAASYSPDLDQAEALLTESLRHANAVGDPWLQAWSLMFLSNMFLVRGNDAKAASHATDCLSRLEDTGDPECRAWAHTLRAAATWRAAGPRQSRDRVVADTLEAIHGFHDLTHVWGLSCALFVTAQLCDAPPDKVYLLGASEALRENAGAAPMPFVQRWLEATLATARAALTPDAFEHAWQEGRQLPPESVLAAALRSCGPAGRS